MRANNKERTGQNIRAEIIRGPENKWTGKIGTRQNITWASNNKSTKNQRIGEIGARVGNIVRQP